MAGPNYIRLITRSWKQLTVLTLLGLVLALALSLVQPLQYSSSVKMLITQTNPTGLDPYTAIKSTERIAQNLSELIYTTAFFDSVTADASIDSTYFSTDDIKKREQWERTISTTVSPGTGIMTVTAYHSNRGQAQVLAVSTARELSVQAPNFFGFSVRAQVIDAPLQSRYFARPNFLVNGAFGAIVGLFIGLSWVLWRVRE